MLPSGEAGIPEHRDLFQRASINERFGMIEVVLGAETDHLDLFDVVSGELPDFRPFGAARGSMGGPEPEQHRAVAIDRGAKSLNRSVAHIEHFGEAYVVADRECV